MNAIYAWHWTGKHTISCKFIQPHKGILLANPPVVLRMQDHQIRSVYNHCIVTDSS